MQHIWSRFMTVFNRLPFRTRILVIIFDIAFIAVLFVSSLTEILAIILGVLIAATAFKINSKYGDDSSYDDDSKSGGGGTDNETNTHIFREVPIGNVFIFDDIMWEKVSVDSATSRWGQTVEFYHGTEVYSL